MAGYESAVGLMAEGGDLPLLQDTVEVDATGQWQAVWRDVIVLDANNEVVTVFNLTQNNLADADNYATLRTILVDAAE